MTITELIELLQRVRQRYPRARIVFEGWNETGDLTRIAPRGDIRLEADRMGQAMVVVR